ncbi:hypothetical protein [Mucilaginibacter sp. SJ]|jgi:hypothetical protein|uniref:hypothetical protein n=1 Tax=Mucilaginibacter sp. SJ TaxID=3029053 RepID=UPI0023A9BE34|nr:hypothetical protein [Mucilaginibacter sp. SJ]WEA01834.1 hypothetical protein MusilaSJ_02710 [Mucilaginibacter sp. SJ]
MIEIYFKRPLLFDYLFASIACGLFYYCYHIKLVNLPESGNALSTTTDLSTIALTLAGFVLTLLTVLVTFKTSAKVPDRNNNDDVTVFDLFFSTKLYYKTTDLLKNGIKSLTFIAVVGFSLKIFLNEAATRYITFWNIIGLVIIVTTLWRNLLILSKIIGLQKEREPQVQEEEIDQNQE